MAMEEKMENQLKRLTEHYNVRLLDMTDIGLDYGIEIAEKLIMKEGFNICVPKNKGMAIYQGRILFFRGKSFEDCLNKILDNIEK
jgi:hypothetical protein